MSVGLSGLGSTLRTMLDPAVAGAALLRRLGARREGAVAIIFGLAAIPVIIGAGIAIDTARAYMVKIRMGAALDAAALAVGSQTGTPTTAQLTTDLKNYFYDNYCKKVPTTSSVTSCTSTVAGETISSVVAANNASGTTTIANATVTYTATATVPTTFMRLVGVNNLTVSVKTQTTKFPGMEIAVVLDNTGSMLCGENEGNTATCGGGEVTSDTDCTNTSDASRICTLRRASLDFISTLQSAITSPQSIYMSITPFVTGVNIGNNSVYGGSNTGLCGSSGGSCTDITTDSTSGDFTDLRGNILPVLPIKGNTTSGSTTVSSVQVAQGPNNPTSTWLTSGSASVATIQTGMYVYGSGIPTGATVSSVSGTSLTLSTSATLTQTPAVLAVGPAAASVKPSAPIGVMGPSATSVTGTWTTSSTTVTSVSSTSGISAGMFIAGCTSTAETSCALFPSGDTVGSVSGTSITLSSSTRPTTAESAKPLFISSIKGTASSGSKSVTSVAFKSSATDCTGSAATVTGSILPGMLVSGPGIPYSTTAPNMVASVSGTTVTLMNNATTGATSVEPLMFINQGGNTTSGSTTISCVSISGLSAVPAIGTIITGNGIPPNTTITGTGSSTVANYTAGTGTLTISAAANTTNNTELNLVTPISYDASYNSASPAGSSTTLGWGGCIMEPTSSGENLSGTGVLASGTNPDTSEPASGTQWYPFFWNHDSVNNWTTSAEAQDYSTEPLATESGSWQAQDGPNQGCPMPILPLTDMTISTGVSQLQAAINSMWPRDSGGTQVHMGAIWGWRTIAPGGPFAANNGHPLSYADANSLGWKKIMVLMTDGTEEAFTGSNLTGLGQLVDGKLNTTSSSTAITTLGTRLATTCTNMAADGVIIYTIGLGSGGSNNTQLQNCPANGGFFSSATTSNIDSIFQQIAASIVHLRLTQ